MATDDGIVRGFHKKRGVKMFIVPFDETLGSVEFFLQREKAQGMNGWYCGGKGRESGGFAFLTEKEASLFKSYKK